MAQKKLCVEGVVVGVVDWRVNKRRAKMAAPLSGSGAGSGELLALLAGMGRGVRELEESEESAHTVVEEGSGVSLMPLNLVATCLSPPAVWELNVRYLSNKDCYLVTAVSICRESILCEQLERDVFRTPELARKFRVELLTWEGSNPFVLYAFPIAFKERCTEIAERYLGLCPHEKRGVLRSELPSGRTFEMHLPVWPTLLQFACLERAEDTETKLEERLAAITAATDIALDPVTGLD